ncbi:MAG: TIGR03752 family integrating conjugative element protein [Gammaproteobacteria bacterium]|nr:TIGR03752 family integrating conjugative element protein [Gammaproteobacteria bacterium]
MVTRSNKLLPVLGVITLIMVVFAGYKAWFSDTPQHSTGLLTEVPKAPVPDADSPAEKVSTLTAQLGEVKAELEARRKQDEEQRQALAAQQQATEAALKKKSEEDQGLLNGIMQRIDDLSGRLTLAGTQKNPENGVGADKGDIPVGLGLDGQETGTAGLHSAGTKSLVWIEPADGAKGALQQAASYARSTGQLLDTGAEQAGDAASSALSGAREGAARLSEGVTPAGNSAKNPLQPYFTVPRNATLLGSTAFTALVGRIPVKGAVTDPMPFKVLVGRDNLAASGLKVPPEVDGMVFSGIAMGDFNLRCSTGRLLSATYVFRDGTIRTLSVANANAGAGAVSASGGLNASLPSLGTISDAQGIPCVSGELITNAPTFLAQRVGVMALEAGGKAAAAAQTTTGFSGLGTGVSAVTGDTSSFVLGQTVAGGASEIRKWLDERQQQSFDAIFTRPGVELVLHIDQEMTIDYDPNGRKLRYDQPASASHRARLD